MSEYVQNRTEFLSRLGQMRTPCVSTMISTMIADKHKHGSLGAPLKTHYSASCYSACLFEPMVGSNQQTRLFSKIRRGPSAHNYDRATCRTCSQSWNGECQVKIGLAAFDVENAHTISAILG